MRGYTWRILGRPEAALVGVQYAGAPGLRGHWLARGQAAPTWLFEGVSLGARRRVYERRDRDRRRSHPARPAGRGSWPRSRTFSGPGRSAHMSYYEPRRGQGLRRRRVHTRRLGPPACRASTPREPLEPPARANALIRLSGSVRRARRRRGPAAPGRLRGLASTLRQYPARRLASAFERAEAKRAARGHRRVRRAMAQPGAARDRLRHEAAAARARRHACDVVPLRAPRLPPRRRLPRPRRPDTLIYADSPGRPLSLVGVMFSMPRGLEGELPADPITRWHWHAICTDTGQARHEAARQRHVPTRDEALPRQRDAARLVHRRPPQRVCDPRPCRSSARHAWCHRMDAQATTSTACDVRFDTQQLWTMQGRLNLWEGKAPLNSRLVTIDKDVCEEADLFLSRGLGRVRRQLGRDSRC